MSDGVADRRDVLIGWRAAQLHRSAALGAARGRIVRSALCPACTDTNLALAGQSGPRVHLREAEPMALGRFAAEYDAAEMTVPESSKKPVERDDALSEGDSNACCRSLGNEKGSGPSVTQDQVGLVSSSIE